MKLINFVNEINKLRVGIFQDMYGRMLRRGMTEKLNETHNGGTILILCEEIRHAEGGGMGSFVVGRIKIGCEQKDLPGSSDNENKITMIKYFARK